MGRIARSEKTSAERTAGSGEEDHAESSGGGCHEDNSCGAIGRNPEMDEPWQLRGRLRILLNKLIHHLLGYFMNPLIDRTAIVQNVTLKQHSQAVKCRR